MVTTRQTAAFGVAFLMAASTASSAIAGIGGQAPLAAALSADESSALEALNAKEGDGPFGTLLRDKIAILTANGQVLDGFTVEFADPDGTVNKFVYQHNVGTATTYLQSQDQAGAQHRSPVSSRSYVTPQSGNHEPSDPRVSDSPADDFIEAINAAAAAHKAKTAAPASETPTSNILTQLGIVGVAKAGTKYDNRQWQVDLVFGLIATRSGSGNHNLRLNTYGYWYTGGVGVADPGDEYDGMDGEWDPYDMVQTGATWVPSGTDNEGPFYYHGTHNINMKSSGNHAVFGGDYQKPDKNSRYNDLYVNLIPKNTAVYGDNFNVYGNYTHTWNFSFLTGVAFAVTFGAFSISAAPLFTGNWNDNTYLHLIV